MSAIRHASALMAFVTACALPALAQSVAGLSAGIVKARATCTDARDPVFRVNLACAQLQLGKARLMAREPGGTDPEVGRCVAAGLAALRRIQDGTRMPAERGRLGEFAYLSASDGSAQPYYLYLPQSYEPGRQRPMIVFLHGYSSKTSILHPWVLSPDVLAIANRLGCIVLIPYGRGNTDFQGIGEVDVLAATEEVKSLYAVDPARIYLNGVSMGGMGAWNLALRHPGMYAATAPACGQTDMRAWWRHRGANWPERREDIPPYRRFLVEWDNPVDLVGNARNQAFFVQHGTLDRRVPVAQTRVLVAMAARLGIPVKYLELAGRNHYIYRGTKCFETAWPWLVRQAPNPSPGRITFKTYSLEYDRAYWLRIDSFLKWGLPATVDCSVAADGRGLVVETTNVSRLTVDLAAAPIRVQSDTVAVTANGKRRRFPVRGRTLQVVFGVEPAAPAGWAPRKRKGLCGPVEEVFDSRFLVVVGTRGPVEQAATSRRLALQWMQDWFAFAGAYPQARFDERVTEDDMANANLVLFGTPTTNSVLARIADRLPIGIGDHSYTVAGRTYAGADLGLVMCYPNPLAPGHYVAIYSGERYGATCSTGHKHDLLPDFLVFSANHVNYDDTNRHEVAGYFDMDWRVSPESMWRRQP